MDKEHVQTPNSVSRRNWLSVEYRPESLVVRIPYLAWGTKVNYCLFSDRLLKLTICISETSIQNYCEEKGNECHTEHDQDIMGATIKDINICCCDTDL